MTCSRCGGVPPGYKQLACDLDCSGSPRPCQQPKTTILLDEGYGLLDLNDPFGRGRFDLLDSFRNPAREVEQWLGMRRSLTFEHSRLALVPGLANLGIKLNTDKEVHSELASSLLRPAAGKNVDFVMAVRAHKVAHVFDHARDVHLHLAKHFDSLAGVLQGNVGWRGHDDCCGQWNCLDKR